MCHVAIKVVWWPSDVEHKPEEAFIARRKPNLSAVWGWGLGFLIFISSYPTHKNPRKAKTSKVSSFALSLFSLIMYSICIAFWVRALLLCFDFVYACFLGNTDVQRYEGYPAGAWSSTEVSVSLLFYFLCISNSFGGQKDCFYLVGNAIMLPVL